MPIRLGATSIRGAAPLASPRSVRATAAPVRG